MPPPHTPTDSSHAPKRGAIPSWLSDRAGTLVVTVLVGVVVAALAGANTLNNDAVYRSRTLLSIDQPVGLAASVDGGLLDKLSRLRLKYADLVATPEIASGAAADLGIPVGQVASAVSTDAPQLSLTLVITARSHDRQMAVDIANASARSLVDYVANELETAGVEPAQRYEFKVLTPAVRAEKIEPTRDSALRAAVSFGLLALGATYVAFEVLGAAAKRRSSTS